MSTHAEDMTPSSGGEKDESIIMFSGNETSADEAAETSVWVERLSARIDYIGNQFDFEVKSKEKADENIVLANINLLGVAPVNVAKHSMYIFKQVTDDENIESAPITLGDERPTGKAPTDKDQAGENYVLDPTTSKLEEKELDNEFNTNILSTINDQSGQLAFTDFSLDKWQGTVTEGTTDKDRIICYTGENTMGVIAQTHGRTTGVIFKAKYEPTQLLVYNDNDGSGTSTDIENIDKYGSASGFYRVNGKIYYDLAAAEAELITSETSGDGALVSLRKNFTKSTWDNMGKAEDLKNALEAIQNTADLGYIQFLLEKLNKDNVELDAETMNWTAFLNSKEGNSPFPTNYSDENQKIEHPGLLTIEYYGPDHLCYYQYWIRHANNGKPDKMGIMEFCIVRNNVYQLAVSSIDGLGMPDPFDSTESPDEGTEEGLYLKVNLYVKNWVVRKNDNIILQ